MAVYEADLRKVVNPGNADLVIHVITSESNQRVVAWMRAIPSSLGGMGCAA